MTALHDSLMTAVLAAPPDLCGCGPSLVCDDDVGRCPELEPFLGQRTRELNVVEIDRVALIEHVVGGEAGATE